MMVALSMMIFAPVAVAQDDNPGADDRGGAEDRGMDDQGFDDNGGGTRIFDDNPGADDRGFDGRGFDDNPTGADDVMASPAASASASASATASATATPTAAAGGDDNPSADDLGGDDRGGQRAFDDNPTGDDATATATAGAGRDDDAAASVGGSLPDTGGMSLLSGAAGALFLVGSGITAAMLLRRTL
jgi:hypothetical protein